MASSITVKQHPTFLPPSDTQNATRISKCLADISKWTTANHLHAGERLPSPSPTLRNLAVVQDDQLCCNDNITSVARSCRIALYNIHRILPFLTCEASQILVQTLIITRLHYCNSLLAGLPASAMNPYSASRKQQHASCSDSPI